MAIYKTIFSKVQTSTPWFTATERGQEYLAYIESKYPSRLTLTEEMDGHVLISQYDFLTNDELTLFLCDIQMAKYRQEIIEYNRSKGITSSTKNEWS